MEKPRIYAVKNLRSVASEETSTCSGPAISIVKNVTYALGCSPSAPPSR